MSTTKIQARFGTWEQAVEWLRAQPEQLDLVEAAYYEDPLIDAAERYWRSEEWKALLPFLRSLKGRALDVGAGRGIASFALAREGFQVTALEPDGSALVGAAAIRDLATTSGLPIEVKQGFSEKLPFADAFFDVVFTRATLHHIEKLEAACGEFSRVLKPAGLFIAVREHVISKPEHLEAFLESHPLHKIYGGENALMLAEYESAICGAGFHLEEVLSPLDSAINYAPYTLNDLKYEVATRLSRGFPGARQLVGALLSTRAGWALARRAATLFDHRPGRLYSFVARRT